MASESEFSLSSNVRQQLINLALALVGQEGENLTASPFRVTFLDPNTQRLLFVVLGGLDESDPENMFAGKTGQPPASEDSMKAMPEVEVSEAGKECTICLEEFEVGAVAKEMPCKHRFHGACVEKWLGVHGTCPMCRYKMPVEEKDGGREEAENGGGMRREFLVYLFYGISNTADNGSSVDESSSSMLDDID